MENYYSSLALCQVEPKGAIVSQQGTEAEFGTFCTFGSRLFKDTEGNDIQLYEPPRT